MMDPRNHPAISFRNVRFGYRKTEPVIHVPSFDVIAGDRIFLYGPSGSGKTTFLSLISGILLPQEGEISVLGRTITRLSASSRDELRGSEIGYIFQRLNLIPYLTVAENIALPCQLHAGRRKRITSGSIAEEIERLATRLDIRAKLSSSVDRLSAGQQQRVAIARAIIGSPSIVIADEPTSSLDSARRDAFLALLTEIAEEVGTTLLFVSHDVSLAARFKTVLALDQVNVLAKVGGE
jgi:putative ABC transport system ATP-binding protein